MNPPPTKDLGALWLQNQYLHAAVAAVRRVPIAIDNRLAAAAWDQAVTCHRLGLLTHTGPDGSNVGDRLTYHGFPWRSAGENIDQLVTIGGSALPPVPIAVELSANRAVRDWMDSAPHRRNLLGDWTAMGGAAVPATAPYGGTFWVVVFAR